MVGTAVWIAGVEPGDETLPRSADRGAARSRTLNLDETRELGNPGEAGAWGGRDAAADAGDDRLA